MIGAEQGLGAEEQIRIRVESEFGYAMAGMVAESPGAIGAVLTDPRGDAIDYVYRQDAISSFDVEVCGAQICQTMRLVHLTALAHGMGRCAVLLEADRRNVLAGMVHGRYLLTMLIEHGADLPRSMRRFVRCIREMGSLLD